MTTRALDKINKELALAPAPASVTPSTFGKLFSCPLDGYAYSQPLYVANLTIPGSQPRNFVFVATEKDSVFAFDADANPCVQLWQTSLVPAGEEAVPTPELVGITSNDIVPFIGITGTPVIDVNSSTLYVVAETRTTVSPGYFERLYALDLATGQPKIRSSGIQISTPTSLIPTFSALFGNQRAALLLDSGTVYVAFGTHRDAARISAISRTTNVVTVTTSTSSDVQVDANVTIDGVTDTSFDGTFPVATQADLMHFHFTYLQAGADASSSGGTATPTSAQVNYHGWLFGYDTSTLQQTMVFDVTPTGIQGGIWQSGGGPSADLNHNVFVATGNGTFDPPPGANDYGDSYMRLNLNTAGALSVADYFTPCDQETMFTTGQDLGSSAPVLLPDSAGSVLQSHLMMGGAKNGSLYVLNRDSLGEYSPPCPDLAPRVQVVPVGDASILSTPLYWNNSIYVAAGNSKLKAFPMASGVLQSLPSSQSPETLGPQGATPVVSSNGTSNAIIWLIDTSGALATPNTPAILRAFDAGNLSNEIYNSAMLPNRDTAGLAVKFTVPTVANGKVYVGTQTELDVYGLLP